MRGTAKTDADSNSRVMMGDWLVGGQFLDPNVNKIQLEISHQRLLIDVIKIWWFLCEIIQ